jgi:AraC-like DNA-binding protein
LPLKINTIMNKTKKYLLYLTTILITLSSGNIFAQGKSIRRIETQEKQAYELYNQGKYQDACKIYIQTTHQRSNTQRSKIEQAIFLFFLVDALGLFLFLYLEKQRAYKKLVSKNMQYAQKPIITEKDIYFKTNNIPDNKDKQLLINLQELFEKEKIYLNKDLNIIDLSKQMSTNKNILSKLINTYLNKTFPTLLNEYRVNEAIQLLTDKKTSNYKMEVISEMCGYNNRQVFHSAFKKETGVTPNDFRKLMKNEQ